jgi:hypothetical protein
MDMARRIDDAVFSIVQDTEDKKVTVKKVNEVIYEKTQDQLLTFDELHAILMRERTKYFMREGAYE